MMTAMEKRRKPQSPMGTLRFVIIAIIFMLLADQFLFKGTRSYIEDSKTQTHTAPVEKTVKIVEIPEPTRAIPPDGAEFFEMIPMEEPEISNVPDTVIAPQKPAIKGKAKIAIVIDDVGMDIKRSKEAAQLPAPVTLALLPYAPRVRKFAKWGKANGHTLIIHVPMEAMDGSVNIGPMGLKENMDGAKIQSEMTKMFASFDGYEGINNHMGSRLTQDKRAMADVMNVLSEHNLFFVDSRTAGNSVAADQAADAGLKFATRDVFLDHQDTLEFVNGALRKVERLAMARGYAIAIGHPKEHTLSALRAWMPTLEAKGIELVSVREVLSQGKNLEAPKHHEPIDMFPDEEKGLDYQEEISLPKGEGINEDFFNQNINEVFGSGGGAPKIELHPLPSQSP